MHHFCIFWFGIKNTAEQTANTILHNSTHLLTLLCTALESRNSVYRNMDCWADSDNVSGGDPARRTVPAITFVQDVQMIFIPLPRISLDAWTLLQANANACQQARSKLVQQREPCVAGHYKKNLGQYTTGCYSKSPGSSCVIKQGIIQANWVNSTALRFTLHTAMYTLCKMRIPEEFCTVIFYILQDTISALFT